MTVIQPCAATYVIDIVLDGSAKARTDVVPTVQLVTWYNDLRMIAANPPQSATALQKLIAHPMENGSKSER